MVFGLCYIAFLTIELIAMWNRECKCWARRNFVINFANIVFVVLQASLIVYYPRLNLNINSIVDRFMNQFSLSKISHEHIADSDASTSWRPT